MKKTLVFNTVLCLISLASLISCSKQVENGLNNESDSQNQTDTNQKSASKVAAFKVIGYFPEWGTVNRVQFTKLTHINYAFAMPNPDGTLKQINETSKLRDLVTNGHAKGVKVMIAIGGGTQEATTNFNALGATQQKRNTFVNSVMALINSYGLDGADIDWEYPVKGVSDSNYALLMAQLSSALHNKGKLLTTAVTGSYGDYIQPSVFKNVDFINIMAYDEGKPNHSTLDIASRSLSHWIGLGLSADKAVLGLPFYGLHATKDALTYSDLLVQGADPYADNYNGYGYNGITTVKKKTDMAFDRGAGIMIWQLEGDGVNENSLLSAIYSQVQKHK